MLIQKEPINKNAFVRLYSDSGTIIRLPTPGMKEPHRTSPALILVPDEVYFIYINTALAPSSWALTDGVNDFAISMTVTAVPITLGTHHILDFSLPGGVPDGIYTIKADTYITNAVEVINDPDEANVHSAFFRISHNEILGDFHYPYAGPSFAQRLRMRCSLKDIQPESEFENYDETNTGQTRSLAGIIKEYIVLETPDFSNDDHGAANYLSMHDNIIVNDITYHRKASSPYRRVPSFDTPLSNGEFGLYNTEATALLRC